MSETTNIAWCDSTANAVIGCDKVSPGCLNCYAAMDTPARVLRHRGIETWGPKGVRHPIAGFEKAMLAMNRKPWICPVCGHGMTEAESKGYLGCPNKEAQKAWLESDRLAPMPPPRVMHLAPHHRRRTFCNSNNDWLDLKWPIKTFAHFLDVCRRCPDMTLILCTKRPENFEPRTHEVLKWMEANDVKWQDGTSCLQLRNWLADWQLLGKAPANIILLASVENQKTADERIPKLLDIPAVCHGLSIEPLLGPVGLGVTCMTRGQAMRAADIAGMPVAEMDFSSFPVETPKLDWIIIGGESGPQARTCNVDWIRHLVAQAQQTGVAAFVKQFGANPFDQARREIREPHIEYLHDKKGGYIAEWPPELRVQLWPKGF